MAQVQVWFPGPVDVGGTATLDVLAVAGGDKAFLIFDGAAGVIRVRLTPQEADSIVSKLAPRPHEPTSQGERSHVE